MCRTDANGSAEDSDLGVVVAEARQRRGWERMKIEGDAVQEILFCASVTQRTSSSPNCQGSMHNDYSSGFRWANNRVHLAFSGNEDTERCTQPKKHDCPASNTLYLLPLQT